MTNALYGPPQAPVDNALYYDDTQGMPRQRPADPLRWLADAVGQNKDLPAPQFFMDPRALSARNMLHSALNTSANWLDGTRDTSRIGPEEVISPLGLAGMGMGVANAMTRAAPDVRIGEALARQHPDARNGGELARGPRGMAMIDHDGAARNGWWHEYQLRDAANPTAMTAQFDEFGLPIARDGAAPISAPSNTNARGPQLVMADNAKGSAPGTVVNSIAEKPYDVRRAEFEQHIKSGKFASEDDVTVPFQYTRLPPNHDDVVRMDQWSTLPHNKEAVDLSKLWATQKSVDGEAVSDMVRGGVKGEPPPPSAYRALDGTIYLVDGHKRMSAAAARGEPTAEALVVGSHPQASAPGLAANSTQQQDDQGVISILRRYGLAD
jgi:hypothetical protein